MRLGGVHQNIDATYLDKYKISLGLVCQLKQINKLSDFFTKIIVAFGIFVSYEVIVNRVLNYADV